MIYCGDCGSENPEDRKFCWKCGKPLFVGSVAQGNVDATGVQTGHSTALPTSTNRIADSDIPAPNGRRIIAFIVDAIFLWVVIFLLIFLTPLSQYQGNWVGLAFLYFLLAWGLTGTSTGKWFMGLYLIKQKDGTPPGLIRSFIRCFVMFLLSPLWIAWWTVPLRKDRRAIHDLAAGTTLVLKASKDELGNRQSTLVALGIVTLLAVVVLSVTNRSDAALAPRPWPTPVSVSAPDLATFSPTILWVCLYLAYGYSRPDFMSERVWQMSQSDGWRVSVINKVGEEWWYVRILDGRTAYMHQSSLCSSPPQPTVLSVDEILKVMIPTRPTAQQEVTFIIVNNFRFHQDFYVDDKFFIWVDTKHTVTSKLITGVHKFQACYGGRNPRDNPENCGEPVSYDVQTDPWTFTIPE